MVPLEEGVNILFPGLIERLLNTFIFKPALLLLILVFPFVLGKDFAKLIFCLKDPLLLFALGLRLLELTTFLCFLLL